VYNAKINTGKGKTRKEKELLRRSGRLVGRDS